MLTRKERILILKLISDPSRYKILQILIQNDGNLCVNEVARNISITPSAVSHQLSRLEQEDIVKPIRKGQNVCYKLLKNRYSDAIKEIISVFES